MGKSKKQKSNKFEEYYGRPYQPKVKVKCPICLTEWYEESLKKLMAKITEMWKPWLKYLTMEQAAMLTKQNKLETLQAVLKEKGQLTMFCQDCRAKTSEIFAAKHDFKGYMKLPDGTLKQIRPGAFKERGLAVTRIGHVKPRYPAAARAIDEHRKELWRVALRNKDLNPNMKVACGHVSIFNDDVATNCSECGTAVSIRPWLKESAEKHGILIVCISCAEKEPISGYAI